MMKNKLVTFATLACLIFSDSVFGQSETLGKVKLKLDYMAYACGECYPQYKVKKILSPQKKKELSWLKDKDIYVEFTDSMAREIESMKLTCETCFTYEVVGTLVKKDSEKIVLTADSYRAFEKHNKCCERITKSLEEGRKKASK